jgi:hypothetical protein
LPPHPLIPFFLSPDKNCESGGFAADSPTGPLNLLEIAYRLVNILVGGFTP